MDSLTKVSQWILEDDFRLIKAIEGGASLESLAKGAVTFSRKFTLSELRDRWLSLLYDPIVSSEFASRVAELNYSSGPSLFPDETSFRPKGKTERVRSLYSAARKRLRTEPLDPTDDLNYVAVGPNNDGGCDTGNAAEDHPLFGQDMMGDDVLNTLNLDESFIQIINDAFPDVLEDIPQDASMDFLLTGCGNNEYGSDVPQNLSSQIGENSEQIGRPCSSLGHDQAFVSPFPVYGPSPASNDRQNLPFLHDFAAEETGDHEEDASSDIDRFIDDLTKSLLDEDDPSKDKDYNQQSTDSRTEEAAISVAPETNENNAVCLDVPSTRALDPHPEYIDGVIVCWLNRESDEIPDNDHVTSELQNPKARKSPHAAARELMTTTTTTKKVVKPPLPTQRTKPRANYTSVDHQKLSICNRNTEFAGSPSSASNDKVLGTEKQNVASFSCLNHPKNETHDDKLEEDALQDHQTQNAADVDMNDSAMEPEEEELEESDMDLPCFSDIEAMILDMDLAPAGQDLYELEVAKYQCEDVKRAIIRLEQAARSCTQRDLASHGAIAMLHGEELRYYIKKPEVLLGRETGEYPIDIDLGRSGTKTKVSRRQALISLRNDGSFDIKNLGKFPMYVNGEEFEHGKVLKLKNNSLIEIRRMAFMFETSETSVKRYLDSLSLHQPN